MVKKKKKGKKRKSALSEAAAKKARQSHWDHRMKNVPIHPDDLESFTYEPKDFQHSLKESTRWRCQKCQHEWLGRPNAHNKCVRCHSFRVQQEDAYFRCLNCDHEWWDFPGQPLFEIFKKRMNKMCPNRKCRDVTGKRHPGNEEDRGLYIKWIDYEEWTVSHDL